MLVGWAGDKTTELELGEEPECGISCGVVTIDAAGFVVTKRESVTDDDGAETDKLPEPEELAEVTDEEGPAGSDVLAVSLSCDRLDGVPVVSATVTTAAVDEAGAAVEGCAS